MCKTTTFPIFTMLRPSSAFLSLYEGFGLPVLEAMSCGCPVVTSNTSSLPEVAGDAALLVDPGESTAIAASLFRLLTDESLRNACREKGLVQAKQFTWDRAGQQLLDTMHAVMRKTEMRKA